MKNIRIAIWGYGITGQSLVRHVLREGAREIHVLDRNAPQYRSSDTRVTFIPDTEHNRRESLAWCDVIIPSPGIDVRSYVHLFAYKWLSELDLFFKDAHKPIVAVTGSVGKTTITTLLSDIYKQLDTKTLVGGNIGTPCLNLLAQHNNADQFLLEVSSFQLEHTQQFAPDCAVITNTSENHLDRHASMQAYLQAKCAMLKPDRNQIRLVPMEWAPHIRLLPELENAPLALFCEREPTNIQRIQMHMHDTLFYCEGDTLVCEQQKSRTPLIDITQFPSITFRKNWLIIGALLHLQGIDLKQIPPIVFAKNTLPHRLENIGTINGVTMYNDSKATTPAATLAAIEQLKSKPLVLFLGGLSKGIDRKPFIQSLINKNISKVYCFGAEADQLHTWCMEAGISSESHKTVDSALIACEKSLLSHGSLLFSPSGSSFDQFENYIERGNRFKMLAKERFFE